MKHSFIRHILLWMIPGIAAGVLAASLLTGVAYSDMAHLAGSISNGRSVAEALKDQDADVTATGKEYLEHYGYRTFGRIGKFLPACLGINVLLFELAGLTVYERERRDRKKRDRRLEELSAYLCLLYTSTDDCYFAGRRQNSKHYFIMAGRREDTYA